MEAAHAPIASHKEVLPQRLPHSNPDQLQLPRPLPRKRLPLQTEGSGRAPGAERAASEDALGGRSEALKEGKRGVEVVSEPELAPDRASDAHVVF